jgi:hypothetical protein
MRNRTSEGLLHQPWNLQPWSRNLLTIIMMGWQNLEIVAIPGKDLRSEPTQGQAGFLGALKAAYSITDVRFSSLNTNELLVSLPARRDPSSFG